MKNKIYHLATCSTCKKILTEIGQKELFDYQDIKTEPITAKQLDEMRKMTDSYESIFSKKSMKYKDVKHLDLKEDDFKRLILEEYTFLKRPVIIIGKKLFAGNARATIDAAIAELNGKAGS